jgi:hypothetical protein
MEHFVRIVMEKQEGPTMLDESIFPQQEIYETEQGATIYQIALTRELTEDEADEYAQRLASYMFEMGHEDFDIEITAEGEDIDEETYDGDDFFLEYGVMWYNDDEVIDEAEYRGRKVPLGKPMRGDVKKFKVYVKDPKTKNVKKVNFGDPDMKIKKSNPERRRSFRARHNCDNPGPRTKARYWSCRKW